VPHTICFDVGVSRFHSDKKTHEEPRVVRIAWLRDDGSEPVCMLVKPAPGTTIDPSAYRYHALTIERLEQDGIDAADVIKALEMDAAGASAIVGFNAEFHFRQLYRLMGVEATQPANAVCAMRLATPILAIPAMRPGGGFKSPNLREACEFFGVPAPSSDDPIELAVQTVRAVKGVYEGCLAATTK
jgi:DNA polymerase III epsilon subunit-like protein